MRGGLSSGRPEVVQNGFCEFTKTVSEQNLQCNQHCKSLWTNSSKAVFSVLIWLKIPLCTLERSKNGNSSCRENTNYTVMSNHHLRDKSISLKAKGLLSQILSLPEEWDYTLQGLACINRERLDAIRKAVHELERAWYIVRRRERDGQGRLCGTEYNIYEQPPSDSSALE